MARRLDAPLEAVSCHVRKVHEVGIIVADEPEVLEGSVWHPYRRVTKPVISELAWDGLSAAEQRMLADAILVRAWRTARAALPRGGWQRVGSHVSRHSLALDGRGFEDRRLDATLVTLFFETPEVDVLNDIVEELNGFAAENSDMPAPPQSGFAHACLRKYTTLV